MCKLCDLNTRNNLMGYKNHQVCPPFGIEGMSRNSNYQHIKMIPLLNIFGCIGIVILIFIAASQSNANVPKPKVGFINYSKIYNRYFDLGYFESGNHFYDRRIKAEEDNSSRRIRRIERRLKLFDSEKTLRPRRDERRLIADDIENENMRLKNEIERINEDRKNFHKGYKLDIYKKIVAKIKKYAEENGINCIVNKTSSTEYPSILFAGEKIPDLTNDFLEYSSKKVESKSSQN